MGVPSARRYPVPKLIDDLQGLGILQEAPLARARRGRRPPCWSASRERETEAFQGHAESERRGRMASASATERSDARADALENSSAAAAHRGHAAAELCRDLGGGRAVVVNRFDDTSVRL